MGGRGGGGGVRRSSRAKGYLEIFVLLTLLVKPFPDVIRLICCHIGVNGVLSRRRQGRIKNGGNGDDAHVLRCLQVLPIINNQVVAVQIWI